MSDLAAGHRCADLLIGKPQPSPMLPFPMLSWPKLLDPALPDPTFPCSSAAQGACPADRHSTPRSTVQVPARQSCPSVASSTGSLTGTSARLSVRDAPAEEWPRFLVKGSVHRRRLAGLSTGRACNPSIQGAEHAITLASATPTGNMTWLRSGGCSRPDRHICSETKVTYVGETMQSQARSQRPSRVPAYLKVGIA